MISFNQNQNIEVSMLLLIASQLSRVILILGQIKTRNSTNFLEKLNVYGSIFSGNILMDKWIASKVLKNLRDGYQC